MQDFFYIFKDWIICLKEEWLFVILLFIVLCFIIFLIYGKLTFYNIILYMFFYIGSSLFGYVLFDIINTYNKNKKL